MAIRKIQTDNNFTEVDLQKQFVISHGLAHLPAGTLCGPLEKPNIATKWGNFEVHLKGSGPYVLPQLIVASNCSDQQNIAIPLRYLRTDTNGSEVFGTPASRQRLEGTLFLIPSLQTCAIEKITTNVIPIGSGRAAWVLARNLLKSPTLILKSVLKHNRDYQFENWPQRLFPKDILRAVIEVASRNFPNPDNLYFGSDPSYSFWTNSRYETLIPRKMITCENSRFPLQAGIIIDDGQDPDPLFLTLNSLLAAGIHRDAISLIQEDKALERQQGFGMINEADFLNLNSQSEEDRFLIVLRPGDCVSRDFLDLCGIGTDLSDTPLAYFDHDRLSSSGTYYRSEFKPDCSPATLLFRNYLSRATIIRVSFVNDLLKKVPQLASTGIAGVIYGASIEATQTKAQAVAHISVPAIHLAEETATQTLRQLAVEAQSRNLLTEIYAPNLAIQSSEVNGATWNAKKPVSNKITIVIPTKNRVDLLKTAVDSIRTLTSYPNYEIVIIDNLSDEPATVSYIEGLARKGDATVIPFNENFNFAKMHNQIVPNLSTDYVLLLNNDTEIFDPSWLTHLVDLFELPNIGIVGNKLLYPDGTIQHAGAVGGLKGPMAHPLSGHSGTAGYPLVSFPRDVLGVTGACLLIPQKLYVDCGGMDEKLAVSYNDMDLCLSVRVNSHLSVVVSSSGGVTHKESKSRGTSFSKEHQNLLNAEADYFNSKWSKHIRPDPFYNINLSLQSEYVLA